MHCSTVLFLSMDGVRIDNITTKCITIFITLLAIFVNTCVCLHWFPYLYTFIGIRPYYSNAVTAIIIIIIMLRVDA